MIFIRTKQVVVISLVSLVLLLGSASFLPVYAMSNASGGQTFVAHLSAAPGVSTRATGEVIFHLSSNGTVLSYKLIAANINNVFMAHIQLVSTHGIVVWLFPSSRPEATCLSSPSSCVVSGRSDGILVQGTITSADLTGSLSGMTMSSLIAQIESGNTYVNVHTLQNPDGEIQGVIK